ncbi:uncharacterized protein LOC117758889 [Hippoglossus hippoglossus]|uniref:uncharacterized protein LOC117758889 n=1 Tax=Hippoglossus hippoglossus TaxID=8267 RepID=UPI00148D2F05|nr:uncharacterized protein LOC117758889 [Hippoglossus hippoglossus]XP_034436811.1 uncharacterized protein LOC117758889 [Hippoglossus hippoglossus]
MGALLKEIQLNYKKAADVLTQAGFETDIDIQSLTREDLHELFPGVEDLRLRKTVFSMIHKPKSANVLLKELRELQNNSSVQTDPGLLMDHIQFIHSQVAILQDLLITNIDLPKNINTSQRDSKADKGYLSETRGGHPQGAQGDSITETSAKDSQEATVKYKMVVGGQTFGAHKQLMAQVNQGTHGGIQFLENSEDSQIIIVFCPITSRAESDVKAAMNGVPGDKPIILVKMHHVCEPKPSLCLDTSIDDRNNVLQVNVFYHENIGGLLSCQLNTTAVSKVQKELLNHSNHRRKDWSGFVKPSFLDF